MTRSIAMLRQLVRVADCECRLLVNSPFAASVELEVRRIGSVDLVAYSAKMEPAEAVGEVRRQFDEFEPACLIVDVFPRGLGGEFAELFMSDSSMMRVLVSRGLPRAYVDSYGLAEFVERHYDLVIEPGEPSPFAGSAKCVSTRPFLIRSDDEIGLALRESFLDRPVLVVGSGTPAECEQLRLLTIAVQQCDLPCPVRFVDPAAAEFPVFERLASARGAIAAAGYNLSHELAALGVPTLLFARDRLYDDQSARANSPVPDVDDVLLFVSRVAELPLSIPPEFGNGAVQAAACVGRLLADGS